jgi:hypothetical protein
MMLWSTLFLASVSVPGDHPTISAALAAVPPGEVIEVDPGVWQAPGLIDKNVEIRGTEHGASTIVVASGGDAFVVAEGVTLTLRSVTLDGDHQYRGVSISENGALVLEDSWCRNGHALNGGCIRAEPGADLVVRRTVFTDNEATHCGGHLDVTFATLELDESRLAHGSAGTCGGAIRLSGGLASIRESRLGENSAQHGGAIFGENGDQLWVEDTWLHHNAADFGGGIALEQRDLMMRGGGLVSNTAQEGGGIHLSGAPSPTLEWVAFQGNAAVARGGGLSSSSSPQVSIENGWFWENQVSDGMGGAVEIHDGVLDSLGTMYRHNLSTAGGGAVMLEASGPSVVDSDFFCGNVAYGSGGALRGQRRRL